MMEVIQSPQKVHKDEDDESDNSLSEGEVGVVVGHIVKTRGKLKFKLENNSCEQKIFKSLDDVNVELENNDSNKQQTIQTHDDDSDIDDCEVLCDRDDDVDTDNYMQVEDDNNVFDESKTTIKTKKPSTNLSKTGVDCTDRDGEHRNFQIGDKPSVKEDTEGKPGKLSTTLQHRDSEKFSQEDNKPSKRRPKRRTEINKIKPKSDGSQEEGNNVSRSHRHSHRNVKKVFYGDCQTQKTCEDSSDSSSNKQDNPDTESYEYSEEEKDLGTRTKKNVRRKEVTTERGNILYEKALDLPPTFPDSESEQEEGQWGKKKKKYKNTKKYFYGKVQCDLCGILLTRSEFPLHMNRHTGEKKYPCDDCGKIFLGKRNLRQHRERNHSERERYPCSVCGQQYATQQYARRHECTAHQDNFPNVDINQPGLRCFANENGKPRYLKTSYVKTYRYTCSYAGCAKTFSTRYYLRDHEAIHRGEIDELTCSVCGATFTIRKNKERHMLIHSDNPRPYICRHCPASFTQHSSRQVHERNHTGERPFKCKFCMKGFTQQTSKTSHEKKCELKTGASEGSKPRSSQGSSSNGGIAKTKQSASVPPVIVQPRSNENLDHEVAEAVTCVLPGVANSLHSSEQDLES